MGGGLHAPSDARVGGLRVDKMGVGKEEGGCRLRESRTKNRWRLIGE